MHTFKVGDRIQLMRPVDRFPDFRVPAGLCGTVSAVEIDGSLAAKMDDHIDGCEEWGNEICWYEDYAADIESDIALLS